MIAVPVLAAGFVRVVVLRVVLGALQRQLHAVPRDNQRPPGPQTTTGESIRTGVCPKRDRPPRVPGIAAWPRHTNRVDDRLVHSRRTQRIHWSVQDDNRSRRVNAGRRARPQHPPRFRHPEMVDIQNALAPSPLPHPCLGLLQLGTHLRRILHDDIAIHDGPAARPLPWIARSTQLPERLQTGRVLPRCQRNLAHLSQLTFHQTINRRVQPRPAFLRLSSSRCARHRGLRKGVELARIASIVAEPFGRLVEDGGCIPRGRKVDVYLLECRRPRRPGRGQW